MTKASERLFETNYCVQRSLRDQRHGIFHLWMSPSQAREKALGYDCKTSAGPRGVELLQFKVPKYWKKRAECYRVDVPQAQVDALRANAATGVSAFFVFPGLISEWDYVKVGPKLLSSTYLLDVADLAGLDPSTPNHRGDFYPDRSIIRLHSEPLEAALTAAGERAPRLRDPGEASAGATGLADSSLEDGSGAEWIRQLQQLFGELPRSRTRLAVSFMYASDAEAREDGPS